MDVQVNSDPTANTCQGEVTNQVITSHSQDSRLNSSDSFNEPIDFSCSSNDSGIVILTEQEVLGESI